MVTVEASNNQQFTNALIIPRQVRAEVARISLLKQIEEAHDAKVIALIAPSGYGKTTLLAQYARATQRPVAWMTLSEQQQGPTQLLEFLHTSLRRVQHTLSFEEYSQFGVDELLEDRARALARDMLKCPENIRIIFDQAHHLNASAYHVIDAFISELGEGHQVLISDYTVHFRLADYAVRGQALILDQSIMRFSTQEAANFFNERNFCGDVETLNAQLEGWPAGLALVKISTSSHLVPEQLIFEALDRLPSSLRQVLPSLSVYELWSPELPEKLGVAVPANWLKTLQTSGLPITPLTRTLFKPHTILLQALTSLLAEQPVIFRAFNKRAGDLYLENNYVFQAIKAFKNAEENEKLIELLFEVVGKSVTRREYIIITDLLSEIPISILPIPLKIAFGDALIYTGNQKAGDAVLRELLAIKCTDNALTIAIINSLCIAGQYEEALETLEQSFTHKASDKNIIPRLDRIRIHILDKLDRDDEAASYAEITYNNAKKKGDLRQIAAIRSVMLHLVMKKFVFENVESYADEILAMYKHLAEPFLSLYTYINLIDYQRYAGRFDEAFNIYHAAVSSLGKSILSCNIDVLMLRECEGDIYLAAGKFDLAVEYYEKIKSQINFTSDLLFKSRIYGKLAELYAKLNQFQSSEVYLKLLRQSAALHPKGWAYSAYFEGVTCGIKGQWAEAEHHLSMILHFPMPFDRRLKALLYTAEAGLRQGRQVQPLFQLLRQNLALIPGTCLLHAELSFAPMVDAQFFSPNSNFHSTPNLHLKPPSILQITTINKYAVCVNGKTIKIPHIKSREILLWLALNGPASRDEIIDAIWGERSHPRAIEYFKISVRRLRYTFNEVFDPSMSPIVYESGIYHIAPSFQVDVDYLQLKNAVALLEHECIVNLLPNGRIEFLPGMLSDWLGFERSSFREIVYAAFLLVAQNQFLKAGFDWATLLTRAIQFEPLNEEAYIALIEQWSTRGQMAQATSVYQLYCKALQKEIASIPDAVFHKRLVDVGFTVP